MVPAARETPASSWSFGMMPTTVMVDFVTPGAVAPPLFSPAVHGFTHTVPPPAIIELKRPNGPNCGSPYAHLGLWSAAAVPMPDPRGGLAVPVNGATDAVAGPMVATARTTAIPVARPNPR